MLFCPASEASAARRASGTWPAKINPCFLDSSTTAKYASRGMNDWILMKSTPLAFSSSTAFLPSSGVAIESELGKRDFGPSSMGPAITMRGPRSVPAEISRFHASRVSRSPPMSRTPVTPLATNKGKLTSRPPGIHSPKIVWTCISHRPGIRNLPLASTIFASLGSLDLPVFSILMMRSPRSVTVMSGWTGDPVASMTLTCVMASRGS